MHKSLHRDLQNVIKRTQGDSENAERCACSWSRRLAKIYHQSRHHIPLIPALGRERQVTLHEFKGCLICIVSSGTAKAAQWDPATPHPKKAPAAQDCPLVSDLWNPHKGGRRGPTPQFVLSSALLPHVRIAHKLTHTVQQWWLLGRICR